MPLYIYNIFAITCLYLAILCLDICKDIPIKGKGTYNKLLSAFKVKLALYILLNNITSINYSGQAILAYY
ncbi:unnamed protein product [Fusarium fujikuroi]|nr:unnamed protein product [Fusarium fujikuroi]